MADETSNRGRMLGIGLCVVVLGAGGVWAGKHWRDRRADQELQAKLAGGNANEVRDALLSLNKDKVDTAVEGLKDKSFSEIREVMRSGDLTDEERQQLRRVRHEVGMARMNERVDEYFNAPEEEREKILDRHIDEFAALREQWRAERERREKEGQDDRERVRRERPRRDRQNEKERMESSDPDRQKRMMSYWGKMRARMQARGIEMRGGPHGMRGGRRGSGGDRSGGTRSGPSNRGGRGK